MESRTKNSTRNIFYGLIFKIVNTVLPFFVRSVFIYKLGKEILGLDSLYISLLQVLNLAELGFSNALVYSMYKPIVDKDTKKICELLSFYKKCYRNIGIIILILGILISPFLKVFISGEVPSNVNIYYAYYIFLINTFMSYILFAYKNSLFIAHQRIDISNKITLVLNIIKYSAQFCIIYFFENYYLYLIVMPIFTILNNIIIFYYSNKIYPEYQPNGDIEKEELKVIKKNVKGMFLQKMGNIAMQNSDSIVISALLGIGILGIFNNYYYIVMAITGFIAILCESLKPSVGNSIIKEDLSKNYNDFKKFNFIYIWIVIWCSCCFMCLLDDFIYLWIGKEMQLPYYMSILFGIYFFIHHWCDMLYIYQEAKGLWWDNRYTQLITAIINFILNIVLVKVFGIAGILIATIITILLITDVGYAVVLFKRYFNQKGYFKNYILKQILYFVTAVVCYLITYKLCLLINGVNFLSLIYKFILCIIIPNTIILVFNCKTSEFKLLVSFVKDKLIRGIKNAKQNKA